METTGRELEVIQNLLKRNGESLESALISPWGITNVKVEVAFGASLTKVTSEKGVLWLASWDTLIGAGYSREEALANLDLMLKNRVKSWLRKGPPSD